MTKDNEYFQDLLDGIELEKQDDDGAVNFASKDNSKKNSSNVLDTLPVGKKEHKKFYKGIYFDEDIYSVISNIVQQDGGGRRNIQSRIVNDCLREAFQNRNFL
jgi:hypothetical protein